MLDLYDEEHPRSNTDVRRPTLVLVLAPNTQLPNRRLIQELRTMLLSIEQHAALHITTDLTRTAGTSIRLYGGWHRPAAAHAALAFLFSIHLDPSEEHR